MHHHGRIRVSDATTRNFNGVTRRMYEPFGCEQVVGGTTEYLERALPAEMEAEFDSHLSVCAGCRRYLRQIRWTIDHLAAIPRERIPPGMKKRLLDALHHRRTA